MKYSARSAALMVALGSSAAILACGSSKTGTISSSSTSTGADQSSNTSAPAALASRLADINACQSRLQNTHGTFPVQQIQQEGTLGGPVLYAFYNVEMTSANSPFTTKINGLNDQCQLPVNNAIGSIRAVLEPKQGKPLDATDPRSFVDIFTDVCGVVVINNESGWYEGWILNDVLVPQVDSAASDGHALFGKITQDDANALKAIGNGQNIPGQVFTVDGNSPQILSSSDSSKLGGAGANFLTVPVSLGAWNALQGEDAHAYWELNEYTNWTFPLYEVPGTGGSRVDYVQGFQYGPLGGLGPNVDSRIAGSGPSGILNFNSLRGKVLIGDDPANPRDADRTPGSCGDSAAQAEKRLRFLPSGLAREILVDVFLRPTSFERQQTTLAQRVYDAYAFEVAKVDTNRDGIVQFSEVDIEDKSADGQPNTRLYIAPNQFNRAAVTREINDGMLSPRLAPSAQAAIMTGTGTFSSSCSTGGFKMP